MSADAVIAVAREEIAYAEYPSGSNRVKYWDIFGSEWQGQPWCVAFLAWCFRQAGEGAAFFGGGLTASCGTLLRWYGAMGQTVGVADIRVGDIVILNFHGTKDTEHCGLVESKGSGYIVTIEGNTGTGNQANGGMVCRKTRYPSQIVGVCRPMYKEEPVKKDDLTGHWAEKACRKAEAKGVMRGYPDGSWAPDKTMTRAELATVLDRLGLLDK